MAIKDDENEAMCLSYLKVDCQMDAQCHFSHTLKAPDSKDRKELSAYGARLRERSDSVRSQKVGGKGDGNKAVCNYGLIMLALLAKSVSFRMKVQGALRPYQRPSLRQKSQLLRSYAVVRLGDGLSP